MPLTRMCHEASISSIAQVPAVQTLDTAIHRINRFPADNYCGNQLRYPPDRDLSVDSAIQHLKNRRQDIRDKMKELRWATQATIDSCHIMIKLGGPVSCKE